MLQLANLQKKLAESEGNTVQEQPNLDAQDEPNIQEPEKQEEQEVQEEQEEQEEHEVLGEVNHQVNQPNLENAPAENQAIMHEHQVMPVCRLPVLCRCRALVLCILCNAHVTYMYLFQL